MTTEPATPLDATLTAVVRWVVPCALLPLLLGGIAFGGWWYCYWNFHPDAERLFVMFAAGTLVVGALAFLLGGTLLIGRIHQARKLAGDGERRRVFMHAGFLGTLLIFDLVLAFFLVVVMFGAYPGVLLHIDNQTNKTIKDVTVFEAGNDTPHVLGNAYGGRVTPLRFRPEQGGLRIVGSLGGEEIEVFETDATMLVGARLWSAVDPEGQVATQSSLVDAKRD